MLEKKRQNTVKHKSIFFIRNSKTLGKRSTKSKICSQAQSDFYIRIKTLFAPLKMTLNITNKLI
jgi:hypothetical protein